MLARSQKLSHVVFKLDRLSLHEVSHITSCVDLTFSRHSSTCYVWSHVLLEKQQRQKDWGIQQRHTKARLDCKYGGSRQQVQSHLDELKKLKTIEENNPRELEKFADLLEQAVIMLKENGRESDLESGMLQTIILTKIPERLLDQREQLQRLPGKVKRLGSTGSRVSNTSIRG